MSDEQRRFFAAFVATGYQKPDDRPEVLLGFKLLEQYNGTETCDYLDTSNHTIIHISRGTARSKDLLPDLAILTNTEALAKRFKMEEKRFQIMRREYPYASIYCTGHSLGGRIAQHLVRKFTDDIQKSIVFNPGSSPLHMARSVKEKASCKLRRKQPICRARRKTVIYGSSKDVISIFGLLDSDNRPNVSSGFHSLSRFLD